MRKLDRVVLAADASGDQIVVLLGETPNGDRTLALRHDKIGTVTAILTDDDLEELISELLALRASQAASPSEA